MTIDSDIRRVARQFGGRSLRLPGLLKAIELAEGNLVKAVQCSEPTVGDRDAALVVTARSIVHASIDYHYVHDPEGFIAALAETWAPVGAPNDPHGLNANWPGNVLKLWRQETK